MATRSGSRPRGDRLGRLKLSFDGLEARDRRVMDWAWQRRLPLAFAMAGGYGTDMEATVQVQVNTYRVALDYHARWNAQVHGGEHAAVTAVRRQHRQNSPA